MWKVYRKRKASKAREEFRRAYRSTYTCLAALYRIDRDVARSTAQQFLDEYATTHNNLGKAYCRGIRAACNAAYRKFDPSQQENGQ
jgi:hypothetical protein